MMNTEYFLLEPMNQDFIAGKAPCPPINSLTQQYKLGGIVVFCFSLVLAVFSIYCWNAAYPLYKDGQVVQGKVVGLAEQPGSGKYLKVVFGFVEPQGKAIQFTQSVRRYYLHDCPPGSPVDIRYLPGNPKEAYLESHFLKDRVGNVAIAGGGTLLLLGLSLWALGTAAVMKRKTLRLAKSSLILEGEITKIKGNTDNIGYCVTACYQFTPPGMAALKGKNTCYRDDLVETGLPEAGSKVKVLYHDPKNFQML